MRKIIGLFLLPLFFFLLSGVALTVRAREDNVVRVTSLKVDAKEEKDYYVVKGDEVEVPGDIKGDVYAFGNRVVISGNIEGDVLAFAQNITVTGNITGSLRGAAKDVLIDGTVGRNVTTASALMELGSDGKIGGGIFSAAERIVLMGPVGGQIKSASRELDLKSRIGSDVEAYAQDLKMGQNASVSGNLKYYSENDLLKDSGASISGRTEKVYIESRQPSKEAWNKVNVFSKFMSFLAAFLFGVLIYKFFPKLYERSSLKIQSNFWGSALTGFVSLFVLPFAALFLLATVVGIPISLVLIMFYLFTLYASKLFIANFIAAKFFKINNFYTSLLVGLAAVYILRMIPVAGGLFAFAIYVLGLGSVLILIKEYLSSDKAKSVNQEK